MGNQRDTRPPEDDRLAPNRRRGGAVPSGSVHPLRTGGDDAPLAGGATGRPRPAVSRGEQENGRVDDNRDARGALAPSRRRRLSADAGPAPAAPRPGPPTSAGAAQGRGRRPFP